MSRIPAWADAIQQYEGWKPGSRSYRNNNPGNLRRWGRYPIEGGYVKFPSYEIGRAALETQLKKAASGRSRVYRPNMTLTEFFGRYAPADDNNAPRKYAEFVARKLKVRSDVTIAELGEG